jgi:hypothetical protein
MDKPAVFNENSCGTSQVIPAESDRIEIDAKFNGV